MRFLMDSQVRPHHVIAEKLPQHLGGCSRILTELRSFIFHTKTQKDDQRCLSPWPVKHPLRNLSLSTKSIFRDYDLRGANAISAGHSSGTGGLRSPELVPGNRGWN